MGRRRALTCWRGTEAETCRCSQRSATSFARSHVAQIDAIVRFRPHCLNEVEQDGACLEAMLHCAVNREDKARNAGLLVDDNRRLVDGLLGFAGVAARPGLDGRSGASR